MTKADLVETISEEFDLTKNRTGAIIDTILDEIKSALSAGDKVTLVPFGNFVVRDRAKREGRNPKTGERLIIAARRTPAFTAGKALRDAVGGPKKQAKPIASVATKKKAAKTR